MKKINNKGYVLVEIILASAIAMAVAYFLFSLTIKLKNKNDDLLVTTLVKADQTLIENEIMKGIQLSDTSSESNTLTINDFDCNNIVVNNKKFTYTDKEYSYSFNVSDYTNISYNPSTNCINTNDKIQINIPIEVKQLPDEDFSVKITYWKTIRDITPPTCSISASSSGVTLNCSDKESGVSECKIRTSSTSKDAEDKNSVTLALSVDTFNGYAKDTAGNEGNCNIEIKSKDISCPSGEGSLNEDKTKCVKSTAANESWSSTRTCRSTAWGNYNKTCSTVCSLCNCLSGETSMGCTQQHTGYYCSDTTYTLSGSNCIKKTNPTKKCPSGYSAISGTDYCYK